MLRVVSFVLAVVCKRMQQLPTMLGAAVHRHWKDTDHKTSMRVSGPNNIGRAMHYASNIVGLCFGDHRTKEFWELLGQKFYWCQTLRNNSQQHAITCNRVCKRTQHMTTNNVASVCKGLKRLYKHNGRNSGTTFDSRLHQPWRKHDRNCRVQSLVIQRVVLPLCLNSQEI